MSTPTGPFEYILSCEHLAAALGVGLSELEMVGDLVVAGEAYEHREKSLHGKVRLIAVPVEPVMSLHRRISDFLWPLLLDLHPNCHGYVPDHSAKTNAAPHCGARWVQRLDIKDFYPSTQRSVIADALVDRGAGRDVADLIAGIVVDQGSLPMGGPCSPLISNLILSPIDHLLAEAAASMEVTYTRYADDLTFSADVKFDMTEVTRAALRTLGYKLNPDKSRLRRRGQSIMVTGLRVAESDFPRLPKQFKRRLRQEFYFIETLGLAEHCGTRYLWRWIDEDDDERQLAQSKRHLQGKVSFALGVEREWMSALLEAHPIAAAELMPPKGQQAAKRLGALIALAADIRARPYVSVTRQAPLDFPLPRLE